MRIEEGAVVETQRCCAACARCLLFTASARTARTILCTRSSAAVRACWLLCTGSGSGWGLEEWLGHGAQKHAHLLLAQSRAQRQRLLRGEDDLAHGPDLRGEVEHICLSYGPQCPEALVQGRGVISTCSRLEHVCRLGLVGLERLQIARHLEVAPAEEQGAAVGQHGARELHEGPLVVVHVDENEDGAEREVAMKLLHASQDVLRTLEEVVAEAQEEGHGGLAQLEVRGDLGELPGYILDVLEHMVATLARAHEDLVARWWRESWCSTHGTRPSSGRGPCSGGPWERAPRAEERCGCLMGPN
mmetsp:Transcript_21488/g.67168  ORF Transcript_21488/g.67168 Transcript_21488/m.67168 type:complete len:302 (-) Transcript_21488:133-1038(-)